MYGNCVDCGTPTDEMNLNAGGDPCCLPCKNKRLGGREPRELTEKEVRARFLDQIWSTIAYWRDEERRPTALGKMEGLAFSILVMLDGESVGMPAFIVAPVAHEDDKEYAKKHQEDWYPHNGDKEQEAIKCDIAGSLHDEFHKHRPKGWPSEEQPEPPRRRQRRIITSDMMNAYSLTADLERTAAEFKSAVWTSLKAYAVKSKYKYHAGIFGDVKLLLASMAGRIMVTLRRGCDDITFIGGEDEPDRGCGIQSINASPEIAQALVATVGSNWDPDKLTRDDDLRII